MKKINAFIIIAILLAVSSVCMMIVAIKKSNSNDNTNNHSFDYSMSEFVPPEFDPNASSGSPNVDETLGYSEIDAQAFRFSICGKPIANSDELTIFLYNPKENTVWLKVRVYDENDKVIGETGIIKPNEYVEKVSLSEIDHEKIKYKIMAYEPETYYSAGAVSLNTSIVNE